MELSNVISAFIACVSILILMALIWYNNKKIDVLQKKYQELSQSREDLMMVFTDLRKRVEYTENYCRVIDGSIKQVADTMCKVADQIDSYGKNVGQTVDSFVKLAEEFYAYREDSNLTFLEIANYIQSTSKTTKTKTDSDALINNKGNGKKTKLN